MMSSIRAISRDGPCLDVVHVLIGVIEQQEDLVVAIKVAAGEALGADPDAQIAQKDKGLVLDLLQLTNLPLQRIGIGRVDAFAQHGAAKLGGIGPLLSVKSRGEVLGLRRPAMPSACQKPRAD